MTSQLRIAFVSQNNAVRAPLAVAIAHHISPDFSATSAGLTPAEIPDHVRVLIRKLDADPASALEPVDGLSESSIDLVIMLCSEAEHSAWMSSGLEQRLPAVQHAVWHLSEPTSQSELSHLEIELAERIRLLLLAKHVI